MYRFISRWILIVSGIVWCVGCAAPPALLPPPRAVEGIVRAEEPAAPIPQDGLTVGTYNVHGLRNRAGVRRDLARLDHVTVWCFQEVPQHGTLNGETFLPPGRWHVATVPVNPTRAGAWESQLIASRTPIDGVEVWPLDDGGAKRRVALAARVNLAGRTVLVVNTDHEPSIFAWRDGNAVQLRRLTRRLKRDGEMPAIVAGDFNCSGNVFRLIGNGAHVRRVDATLDGAGFVSLAARGPTFRCGVMRARLDRIYARGVRSTGGAIATASRGSDHLAVWSTFALAPAAAAADADAADRRISDPASAQ